MSSCYQEQAGDRADDEILLWDIAMIGFCLIWVCRRVCGFLATHTALTLFIALFLWRYVRFVVNYISYWNFKPIPLPARPSHDGSDVTVVIPTICGEDTSGLSLALASCLAAKPRAIIIVTVDRDRAFLERFAHAFHPDIRVLSVRHPNKRRQVAHALPHIRTRFTILADDDVVWPETLLPYIHAPFEDPSVGAVGTRQVIRPTAGLSLTGRIYEYLGACYIERRNFEITATSGVDGGISCLSGRTACFRTAILQDPRFVRGYRDETWRTGRPLNPDDDNFVTRWLVAAGWRIAIQRDAHAVVQTRLGLDHRTYWRQCLRWSRSNWRSNWTSTVRERVVWRAQPWSTYALYLATPTCSLVTDPALVGLLVRAGGSSSQLLALAAWMVLVKFAKLVPVFRRRPWDLLFFVPVTIPFGYLHGVSKYYALWTVDETGWGTRPDVLEDVEKGEAVGGGGGVGEGGVYC